MALGTELDIEIHRGDDRLLTLTVKDEAGVVVDINGATMTWIITAIDVALAITQPKKGSTPIETKTVGNGITLTDALNGVLTITLDSADTTGQVAPTTFYHELQMVLGGFTTTLMYGKLSLVRENIAPGP